MLKLDLVEMEGIYCLSGQLKKLKDRYAVTYHQDELEDDTAKKLLVNEFGSRLRQTMQNNYERNILDETTVGEGNLSAWLRMLCLVFFYYSTAVTYVLTLLWRQQWTARWTAWWSQKSERRNSVYHVQIFVLFCSSRDRFYSWRPSPLW